VIDCGTEFNTHTNPEYRQRCCLPMSQVTHVNGWQHK